MLSNLALDNALHVLQSDKIFSVSELSASIKNTVEKGFVNIRIQGEVSGTKKHSSGHTYLSLKDGEAIINAICWRGTKLSFPLEDGIQILARGRVSIYPSRSQYQFIIEEANISGEGTLLKLLNERKKKFFELGYFNKKRPLPKFPNIIGIITSKTGAVIEDMLHRLRDRYPFCKVIIWPVNVQGLESAVQVVQAIEGFNDMTNERPDILIVARGGGSIEDLWSFNEEIVVRAAFKSEIPLISAIGHETDTTLIDYASDLRAPTPTAAIELATPVIEEIKEQVLHLGRRSELSLKRTLHEKTNMFLSVLNRFSSSKYMVMNLIQRFDDKIEKMQFAAVAYIKKSFIYISDKKVINLSNYLELKKANFNNQNNKFSKISETYTSYYTNVLDVLHNRLIQGSYVKILEKGFCFLTNDEGKTVPDKITFNNTPRENLSIHFKDGTVSLKKAA